ncbi:MAG: HemK2/MTQ2 family protein methyltransferase [Nanoarchaeota archaeon]
MIYEPKEDSYLIEKHIKNYAKGNVLDVGTGSGILANKAEKFANKVYAIDIQSEVIKYCKKEYKNKNIIFLKSDLFSALNKEKISFDLIIFNPPYLPNDPKFEDITLFGGKKGYETIEKFFLNVSKFLKSNGKILLLFSNLTNKEKVDEIINNYGFSFELIDKEQIFFEILYVYLIKKTELLKKLENKKIKKIRYFSKGKRGIIFQGILNNKKVLIKSKNPNSKATFRIENETNIIKKLEKYNIGPKIIDYTNEYFIYTFNEGIYFLDYIINNSKTKIIKVIKEIFRQLKILDELKINKEEMHNPRKHIIIGKNITLIDFERSHFTKKPKNITQFSEFLCSKTIKEILDKKNILIDKKKVIKLCTDYKQDKINADKLISYFLKV